MGNSLDSVLKNALTTENTNMKVGYTPTNELDIATKKYVDDNSGTGIIRHGTTIPLNTDGNDGDIYFKSPAVDMSWDVAMATRTVDAAKGEERGYVIKEHTGTGMVPQLGSKTEISTIGITSLFRATYNVTHGDLQVIFSDTGPTINYNYRFAINGRIFVERPAIAGALTGIAFIIKYPPSWVGPLFAGSDPVRITLIPDTELDNPGYAKYTKRKGHWVMQNELVSDGSVVMNEGYKPNIPMSIASKKYVDMKTVGGSMVHHGSIKPADTFGENGDIFYRYSSIDPHEYEYTESDTSSLPPNPISNHAGLNMVATSILPSKGITGTRRVLVYRIGLLDAEADHGIGLVYDVFIGVALGSDGVQYLWLIPAEKRIDEWNYLLKITHIVLNGKHIPFKEKIQYADRTNAMGTIIFRIDATDYYRLFSETNYSLKIGRGVDPTKGTHGYDVYMKVGGSWFEHNPIQANGSVKMDFGYTAMEDMDVATKIYVDDKVNTSVGPIKMMTDSDAIIPPMPPGILPPGVISHELPLNSFFVNEHGVLKFKKADGTVGTVTIT